MPHPPIRRLRPRPPRFGACVTRLLLLLLNLVLLQPLAGALVSVAGPLPPSPEQTLRQLTLALLRGDRQAVLALTRGDRQQLLPLLLLLGLFGVSEIPFLLEHRGGRWRAVPQPWLPLLLR
jgi:hypothetical protein